MIELTIKTLDSRNHSFSVEDEFTVKQLKEQIAGPVNIPADSQRLIYCGRVLVDDKKLSEYNVHGKVIHLVQRPPPTSSTNDSGNSGSTEPRPSTNRRSLRAAFINQGGGFRGFEGPSGNSMYLGAMAFPADVMDAQGINLPTPRNMSQSRILPVRSFLRRARFTLQNLENPTLNESPADENNQPQAQPQPPQTPTPVPAATTATSGTVNPPIDFSFVAQALSDAMSRAAGSFGGANVTPPIINVEVLSAGIGRPMASSEEQPPIPEEVVEEIPIDVGPRLETTGDTSPLDASEDQTSASRENGRGANGGSTGPSSRYLRPAALGELVHQMMLIQDRLNPHLQRYYELLRDDAPVENAQEAQQLFNSVGELLHLMAHAYHAVSDVMCDFSQPPPRSLQSRPVLIQHSAVLQTGIPIQVNLGGGSQSRGTDTGTASGGTSGGDNVSANNNSNDETTAPEENSASAGTRSDFGSTSDAARPSRERTRSSRWDRGSSESYDRSVEDAFREQRDRTDRTPPRERRHGRAFNLPGSSLEFIMDLGHGSVHIDSVEATVIPDSGNASGTSSGSDGNSSQPANGANGGGGGGGLGELFNLWEAIGHLTNLASRAANAAASVPGDNPSQPDQPAPPENMANASPNNISTSSPLSNTPPTTSNTSGPQPATPAGAAAAAAAAANAAAGAAAAAAAAAGAAAAGAAGEDIGVQVWTSTGTQPTTSTQTRPSSRPHVHFAPSLSGIGMPSFFDPFLPCSSHHIRNPSWRRSQGQQQEQQGTAQPQGASNGNSNGSSNVSGSAGISGGIPRGIRIAPDVTVVLQSPSHITMEIPMGGGSSSRLIDAMEMPGGYVEGTSLFTDMFLALARQLTVADFRDLNYRHAFPRARRHLMAFFRSRLTQGRDDMDAIKEGVNRFVNDIRPLLDASLDELSDEPMRSDVDLRASINLVNSYFLPRMVHTILSRDGDAMCYSNFRKLWLGYFQTLLSIIYFCCRIDSHANQILVSICVRFLSAVPGMHLRLRYQVQSQLEQMLSIMSPDLSYIRDFIVYRMGGGSTSATLPSTAAVALDIPEPSVATAAVTPPPSQPPPPAMEIAPPQPSTTPQPMEVEDSVVVAEQLAEELPDVIIDVHPEWVPIISRDRERQRRQAVQGPLSDSYLSGMPSKRRKIVSSTKPQGSLARVISDSMSTAIRAANVPVIENVLETVSSDSTVRRAYREQIRQTVGSTIRSHPDFKPDKYPNSAKLFEPK